MLEIAAVKAASVVASVVVAGGAVVGVGAAKDCPAGQDATLFGCAVVTTAPDEVKQGTNVNSAVTVDVDFRDAQGNRTSSGMGNEDQFQWLGGKKPGKNGDGALIQVRQLTRGQGGWGPLYEGWIPVKYTQIPSMFR